MLRWVRLKKSHYNKDELDLIKFIIKKLGYRPKNIELFKRALTHKSISNKEENLKSNERLEFLGDAIFDAIVAEYLFEKFPDKDEGFLTKLKSKIVSRRTLSKIGEAIGLRNRINYQKGRSVKIATLEGNALEALIGAIYLDSDYNTTKKVIIYYIFRLYLDLTRLLENEIDFKSSLFIWCQKNKLELQFKVIREEQKGSSWEYESEAYVNGQKFGRGIGESKKAAEQFASKETLFLLGEIEN